MLIMGTSKDVITSTKKILSSIFDMKDLGLADLFLGVQIKKRMKDTYLYNPIMWKFF